MSADHEKAFVQSVETSVARHWPDECAKRGAGATAGFVASALKQAESLGLASGRDLTAFVHLKQFLETAEPDFVKNWGSAQVFNAGESPAEKLRLLLRQALALNSPQPAAGQDDEARVKIEPSPFAPEVPAKDSHSSSVRFPRDKFLAALKDTEDLGQASPRQAILPCMAAEPDVYIAILEAPLQSLLATVGPPRNTIVLHGIQRRPPAGGVLTWTVLNGNGFVNLVGPTNQISLTAEGTAPGAALIALRHVYAGRQCTDQVTIEVVSVVIQQAPRIAIPHGNPLPIQAVGTPGGGGFAWALPSRDHVDFPGGVAPGTAALTLATVNGGTTYLDVTYTRHNVTAQASVVVDVVAVSISEAPLFYLAARGRQEVHAQGAPGQGQFQWRFANPGVAAFRGPSAGSVVRIDGRAPGSVQLTVDYHAAGLTVSAQTTVCVIGVRIQEGPEARTALGTPLQLTANGNPGTGDYRWSILKAGIVSFHGGNQSQVVTLDTVLGGTTQVNVEYYHGNVTVKDSVTIDVVSVTIEQASPAAVRLPAEGTATLQLSAIGHPAHGTWHWAVADTSIAAISGASDGNTVVLSTVASGTTQADVTYTFGNTVATASITVHVVEVRIQGANPVAIVLPVGPAATQALQAVGTPGPGVWHWEFTQLGIASFNGPVNSAAATLATAAAGATKVRVKYTFAGLEVTDERDIFVVAVAIQGSADRAMVLHRGPAPANTCTLRATGAPPNGTFNWSLQTPAVAAFQGGAAPVNSRDATFVSVSAGTTGVDVTYDLGGVQATATVQVHVIRVEIQEGNRLNLLHPANPLPGNTQALNAVGTPAGGIFAWQPLAQAAAPRPLGLAYQGPVNAAAASVRTQNLGHSHAGAANVRVQYTLHNATDTASTRIDVKEANCSMVDWGPPGPVNVVAKPLGVCVHLPGQPERQHPSSAGAGGQPTGPPSEPHHHGERCNHCGNQGRSVYHFLNCDSASQAVQDVIQLRDQIHQLRALPNHARAAYVARHPWLTNIPAHLFNPALPVTAFNATGPPNRGKMIGVLRGTDRLGRSYRLLGVSGNFQGAVGLSPNNYWARRIPQHWVIDTASRGQQTYAHQQAPPAQNQFGKCAATHLLSEALQLDLQIESMAEIWLGGSMAGGGRTRLDGEMVASCTFCREYLKDMLCDAGGNPRGHPYAGVHTPPNRGLLVTIQEEPSRSLLCHTLGQPARTVVLHSQVSVPNGAFTWTVNPPGIAVVQGAANQANVTLATIAPGSAAVTLQYAVAGMTETATLTLNVVSVTIAQAPSVAATHPAQFQLQANAIPGGGTFAWALGTPGVVTINGANNAQTVTLDTVAAGNTNVTVTYTHGTAIGQSTISVQIA